MPFNPMHSFLTKPTCPSCDTPIHWGITTKKEGKIEICNVCKTVLG